MAKKDITSVRGTLEFLQQEGELLTVEKEVDPVYEISGIQKAVEGGPAVVFQNIKGYPGARSTANILGRDDLVARIFDVEDARGMRQRCLNAIRNPLPPQIVDDAPVQEVVITKDIDVWSVLPMIKHTERDAGRILGGSIVCVSGEYFHGGTEVSYKRMHFRGKDWASLTASPGTHLEAIGYMERRREKIPMTINISPSPAIMVVAGGGSVHSIIHAGMDEVGIAGAIQQAPVRLAKAKTVDALSIADAEYVLEGYWTPERVWETEEAEKAGKEAMTPFFPEWPGYLGMAWRSRKFECTAITHRKDQPIFNTPLAHGVEVTRICKYLREACYIELAERMVPGLVIDANILDGLTLWGGVVLQVRKRRVQDDGWPKNLIVAALGASPGIRLVIAVDHDVNIENADDVMWAITTRMDPGLDLIHGARGGRGVAAMPAERAGGNLYTGEGGLGMDATVPYDLWWRFERAHYAVDRVDVKQYFSPEQLASARAKQNEYARWLSSFGG